MHGTPESSRGLSGARRSPSRLEPIKEDGGCGGPPSAAASVSALPWGRRGQPAIGGRSERVPDGCRT
eukprot:10316068-Alexandrium_andersonii.AAC.1